MKKLEAWKKANKPNSRSILHAFSDELFELKKDGYTQQQMLVFLSENGIKTTKQNLSAFLGRAQKTKNLKIPQGVKNEEKKVEKPQGNPTAINEKNQKNDTEKQAFPSSGQKQEAAEKPNKYANLTPEEKQALVAEKFKKRSNQ